MYVASTTPQENYFFDGSQQELESKRCVLRLRFYNGEEKVVITCKVSDALRHQHTRAHAHTHKHKHSQGYTVTDVRAHMCQQRDTPRR